jgi:uncharacterized protein (DUF697 family)
MTNSQNTEDGSSEEKASKLLQMVRAVAIKPSDAKAFVEQHQKRAKAKHPTDSDEKARNRVADAIIRRYSKMASLVGGASALPGVVPGLGTALAATGGASADAVVCMKFQIDMCYCLTENYGYDITSEDAQHLSFLIAAGGTLEKAGVSGGTKLATQAGVRMLRQYLKGAALQAVKEFFKKIGITFTRKAAEKALPFGVGVVIGSAANYGLTRYVGKQAKKWYQIDRQMPDDE